MQNLPGCLHLAIVMVLSATKPPALYHATRMYSRMYASQARTRSLDTLLTCMSLAWYHCGVDDGAGLPGDAAAHVVTLSVSLLPTCWLPFGNSVSTAAVPVLVPLLPDSTSGCCSPEEAPPATGLDSTSAVMSSQPSDMPLSCWPVAGELALGGTGGVLPAADVGVRRPRCT